MAITIPSVGNFELLLVDRPKLRLKVTHRSRLHPFDRFGGCWRWSLGFQADSSWHTVIINLLIVQVRMDRYEHPRAARSAA